jgi:hypothetical protein
MKADHPAASVNASVEPGPGDALKATAIQHRDHYVSRLYLKHFAAPDGRIFTYRILAADARVPLWKPTATKGIAYHEHLYTRIAAGVESDEIEKWLNTEFETPAEEPLMKATSDMRLSPKEWHNLIRFVAAQDVRTPAHLHDDLQRWNKNMAGVLDKTLRDAVGRAEAAKRAGQTITTVKSYNSDLIPLRVTTAIQPGEKFGTVKSEIIVGRGLWFFGIRHLLTKTIEVLLNQKWTILLAPDGLDWFTSDDPVIRLNYYDEDKYDFRGGWGRKGGEIMLPLDSHHLLYTKIGERPRQRGSIVARPEAQAIRRFIAEHAHRFILATSPDPEVAQLRPRTVDAAVLRHEQRQWRKWHEEQSAAERELLASRITAG